ncbi:MAG: hypothetical protein RBR43_06040 [Desulfuromonadaceae bacterium]|jgi:hypothetical protein|nr:hypothetical protein [Desulfuromonas sp.]MDY0185422.1 hypothetical protein [Desulfuromonadaceae bacterium]
MMVRVQYSDGNFDYVSPTVLDNNLLAGRIKKFLRTSGWAIVGHDPIRRPNDGKRFYFGPEKRKYADA